MTQAQQKVIAWFKTNDPFLYEVARKRYELESGNTMAGVGDFFSSLADTVKNVGSSILQYQSQKDLVELQIERAKNNLPPLDSATYIPSVQTNNGELSVANTNAASSLALKSVQEEAAKMKQYFLIAGAAAVAYAVMRGRR